jgi:glutamate dehydrogenase (NAD(P)+)
VDADRVLFERWNEIFVIPDILCNAGGVIVSYFERVQGFQSLFWNETEVVDRLFRLLETSFSSVIRRAREEKIPHRPPGRRPILIATKDMLISGTGH